MSAFFKELVDNNLINQWAATLDWLFNDNKFDKSLGWDSAHVSRFTKAIKRLPDFSPNHYQYGTYRDVCFPHDSNESFTPIMPTFIMHKGESEGKDVVRHVRNGIAHGKTTFYHVKGELYVRICDFGKEDTKKAYQQTAFIAIPMYYIPEFCKLYNQVENSLHNDNGKIAKNKPKKKQQKK